VRRDTLRSTSSVGRAAVLIVALTAAIVLVACQDGGDSGGRAGPIRPTDLRQLVFGRTTGGDVERLFGVPDERALASLKKTDLLVVGLRHVRPELDLDPQHVEGRAALWSFGFLLRLAAAKLLDINEWELRVGLRVVRNAQDSVVGQIFLSDSLENGAGYCSQYATRAAMEGLLRFVSDPTSKLLAPIIARVPSGRMSTTDEVGAAVVFLASDAATNIHGLKFTVDISFLDRPNT